MEDADAARKIPDQSSGLSVVLVEGLLQRARTLGIVSEWEALWLGHETRRRTSYRPSQRIAALLAGLACGLRGIGPGNLWLRPNSALQQELAGKFPDQGTIHRWLQQTSEDQAAKLRQHLHRVVRKHGRFRRELYSSDKLIVDIDGQGLVARGRHFEKAALGYQDDGFERGYQRFACYVASTREVLDELLWPGNESLMKAFPHLLEGLNEVFSPEERQSVVLRADSHSGTVANIKAAQQAGYHYLFKLMQCKTVTRIRDAIAGQPGTSFTPPTDEDPATVTWWELPAWELVNKDGPTRRVTTRVILYHDQPADPQKKDRWWGIACDWACDGEALWQCYRDRGGTIEEYFDQSERAYHLDLMRTRQFGGLAAYQVLVGLCWNLTCWATEELTLPPPLSPSADRSVWVPASAFDLSAVMQRACHSGLRLARNSPAGPLEVEDTAATPESTTWLKWLRQPIQRILRLAG
jgi:hypothetical protein